MRQQIYLILLLSRRQFRYQRGFLCDVLFPTLCGFLQAFAFTLTFSISVSFTFCFSCFLWSGLYFILLGRQVAMLHSCRTRAQLASLCHDPAPLQCNDDCPVPHLRLQASLARSEVCSSIPQNHASISQYVCVIIWQSETLHFACVCILKYLDFCINSS